jgi:hypothetical protein
LFAGFVELLVLYCLTIPLSVILSILGVRFVVKNKVDVQKSEKYKGEEKKKEEKDEEE